LAVPLMREFAILCFTLGALAHQATALAWGDRGHRIIAAIAYEQLVPEARREADALLADDRGDKLTAPDFISRAAWADMLLLDRKTPSKTWYNATRFWHFAEFEIDAGTLFRACYGLRPLPSGKPASRGPAKDCVASKVEQFAAELRDPAIDRKEKILALKFLVHLVGDLHQPLHVADNDDVFGNAIKVRPASDLKKKSEVNLHEYWDVVLVDRALAGPDETERAAARRIASAFPADQVKRALSGGPREWLLETVEVARNVVYDFSGQRRVRDGFRSSELFVDASYDARALPAVNEQLAKAGFRLARLLNQAFAPGQADSRQ